MDISTGSCSSFMISPSKFRLKLALILSRVRQYQKTRHIIDAGKMTNGSVISSSSSPSAEGASWKKAAPDAVEMAKATRQLDKSK